MTSIRSHMTFGNLVALVALFVALGGGAYAAVGNPFVGTQGTIHGCVAGGALHVVKAGRQCPSATTSLPFAQAGPQGPQGPQGAPGGTAFFASGGTVSVSLSGSVAGPVVVLAKSGVPAGTYAITGKVNVTATDAHPGTSSQVSCELDDVPASGATVGDADSWAPVTDALVGGTYEDQTTLSLVLDLKTTGTSTISLACEDVSNNNATASFTLTASRAEISAVQVGALR